MTAAKWGQFLARSIVRVGAAVIFGVAVSTGSAALAETKSLTFYNAHTKERGTFTFKRNGRYDQSELTRLNRFMRDWRQNEPIKMDPKLWDILWEVYEESGGRRPITVVCGYRSQKTNDMLRRRSKGVAQNSLHTKGRAVDFYIPGVDLAKLRAIGLRLQAGGVGFYPRSGSPFVHMDTGSVRHWPKMSRSQLVKVFPNGKTLHVPSDGKPLPGYSQALAAYKIRQARGIVGVPGAGDGLGSGTSVVVADAEIPTPRSAPMRPGVIDAIAVAMAQGFPGDGAESEIDDDSLLSYPPTPGLSADSQHFAERFVAASGLPGANQQTMDQIALVAQTTYTETPVEAAIAYAETPAAPVVAYAETPEAQAVDLIAGLVAEERYDVDAVRTASLPIEPTAVVDTVDLSRPLRANAITTAVLRGSGDIESEQIVPPVMAYASAGGDTVRPADQTLSVPVPQNKPQVAAAATLPEQSIDTGLSGIAETSVFEGELTLTRLDTQSLRWWIAAPLVSERRYALLTVPDFADVPMLLESPVAPVAIQFAPDLVGYTGQASRFTPVDAEQTHSVAVSTNPVILGQ